MIALPRLTAYLLESKGCLLTVKEEFASFASKFTVFARDYVVKVLSLEAFVSLSYCGVRLKGFEVVEEEIKGLETELREEKEKGFA